MQTKKKFDKETVNKVKRSALIAFGGFVVAALPTLLPDIQSMLASNPTAALFVGALGTWIVNTVREWLKGVEQYGRTH